MVTLLAVALWIVPQVTVQLVAEHRLVSVYVTVDPSVTELLPEITHAKRGMAGCICACDCAKHPDISSVSNSLAGRSFLLLHILLYLSIMICID